MSPLFRSILPLFFGGLLLSVSPLCAQTPPPLPRPQRADTRNTLKGLSTALSGSRVTHPQADSDATTVQAVHQDEQSDDRISPPKPVSQVSFSTRPASTQLLALEEGSIDNEQSEESSGEEHEYNAMLDKKLLSKKNTVKKSEEATKGDDSKLSGWTNKLVKPELTPVLSVGGSLLIVIAAFFLLVTLFRKVSPQGNRPLPKEAFECLGRYFLTQKHQLQVLRLGNRIVLVSVMPEGVATLAEITDPDEAVQFLGLCRRLDSNSATEVFRKAVANMSDDELSQQRHRPVVSPRRNVQSASLLDLYSDPDESLATLLARGKNYGR